MNIEVESISALNLNDETSETCFKIRVEGYEQGNVPCYEHLRMLVQHACDIELDPSVDRDSPPASKYDDHVSLKLEHHELFQLKKWLESIREMWRASSKTTMPLDIILDKIDSIDPRNAAA